MMESELPPAETCSLLNSLATSSETSFNSSESAWRREGGGREEGGREGGGREGGGRRDGGGREGGGRKVREGNR